MTVLRHYDKDTSRDMLLLQLAATRPVVQPETGVTIGTIDADAWRQTERIMQDQGLISEAVHIDQALRPQFLPELPNMDETE